MKKINNFDEIQENGQGFKRIPDGAYIVGVKKVEDNSDKEFLRLELDVCKGDYKNWFQKQYDADTRNPKYWPRDGVLIRSYKDAALPFFKGFIAAVTKSNKNFTWNWDEQSLKNKLFGVVIATEEYQKNNGKIGQRPYIDSVHSVEAIEKGDFTIPELKKLSVTKTTSTKAADDFVDPFADDDKPNTAVADSNSWDDSNPFSD